MKLSKAQPIDSMTQAIDLLSKIHAELKLINKSHAKEEEEDSDNSKPTPPKAQKGSGKKCAKCGKSPCECED